MIASTVYVHSSVQPTCLFCARCCAMAGIQWWAKAYHPSCHKAYSVVWDRNWSNNHINDYRITNQCREYEAKELEHIAYNEGTDLNDQRSLS